MRISVFGMGYVGAVSAACLSEMGHDVVGVDTNRRKVDLLNAGQSPIVEEGVASRIASAVAAGKLHSTSDPAEAVAGTDVSFVSVGTPSDATGSPTLSIIDSVIHDIASALRHKNSKHTVVLRSTVLPGTTQGQVSTSLIQRSGRQIGDDLELCYNPEFLREGSAVKDFYTPPFTVVGSINEHGYATLENIYEGLDAPFVRTSCQVAESLKYVSNSFHAVKITFANEIGTLLKELGMDSREAMNIFCQDTILNISPAYLRPGFAFGGSCLPKELRALESLARVANINLPMISQLLHSNQAHIERAFDMITRHGRGRIALFGLAFKPGTDDLRESPLVTLAERLIGRGYELSIYDKSVDLGCLMGANRDYIEKEIPHLERLLVRSPEEALDGAKTIVIGHVGRAEIDAIKDFTTTAAIVDLQGVEAIKSANTERYEGICW